MHYNTLAIASLLSASTLAAVIPAQKVQKRETELATFDAAGNTKVHMSDTKMNFGTINPIDVINSLYDNCYDDGICNPGPYQLQTSVGSSSGSGTDQVPLTVTLQGDFVPWVKNGLVEALVAAASQSGVITSDTVDMPNNAICATPPACPPITTTPLTTNTFASAIGISYQGADDDGPSYINMAFSMDTETGSGACQTLTAAASAIAGAVNGAAGGAFSLIGLFCD